MRYAKAGAALSLVALAAYALISSRSVITSGNAVVSANMLNIRAPIDGKVSGFQVRVGEAVGVGSPLAHIENVYVDDQRLTDLRQEVIRDRAERDAYRVEYVDLSALLARLHQRAADYNREFAAYLTQQVSESDYLGASVAAARLLARQEFGRQDSLGRAGWVSNSAVDQSRSELSSATGALQANANRSIYLRSRADAASHGISLDTGSNDVSYSAQRADEVEIRLSEVDRSMLSFTAAEAEAEARLAAERGRVDLERSTDLVAPENGMVWEVNAVNGETVTAGNTLVRIVDCRDVFLLAPIPQDRFSDISVGGTVRIRVSGARATILGRVASIIGSGVLLGSTDFAVIPSVKASDAAAIAIIALPEASTAGGCLIGRTARVLLPSASGYDLL